MRLKAFPKNAKIQNTVITSIFIIFVTCNAAKIFCIFPIASYSHQKPMLALSRALASRGHNLTVITTNPSQVPIENHREININHLYNLDNKDPVQFEEKIGFTTQKRQKSVTQLIKAFPAIFKFMTASVFNSSQIQNLIKEVNGTNFDLMIVEPLVLTSLMIGFSDLIGNPPIVGISSCIPLSVVDFEYGNPIIPSYIPEIVSPYTDSMSLFQRIINFYVTWYNFYMLNVHIQPHQEKIMREQFGNAERFLRDLEVNKSLLIVSGDFSTSYPRPVQPNTIYVGPMHLQTTPAPLPEDLKKWMDEAEDGIIYFSLGSNMKITSVPGEKGSGFIKAFKQLRKIRVMWKWEADEELPGRPDNIMVKKITRTQSIAAHPKLKLFISQVGLQSFQEAVYNAVPILGIPMVADEDYNTMKLVKVGAGLFLEFEEINYDVVYEKIKGLLTNKSCKENMMRLSSIMKDKPLSAVDTAVWWVEYTIRHKGAPHLSPAALDLRRHQDEKLDAFFLSVLIMLIIRFVICFTIKVIRLFYSPEPLPPVASLALALTDDASAASVLPKRRRIPTEYETNVFGQFYKQVTPLLKSYQGSIAL
ncbi:UDP-glucosyltransferase 2-like [Lycorma delicatula]|uniref:UDP-glucosyltransferase 2-like n=1 Tax=Lycorma delicatula TaxID=130591 RepID=UPI003F5101D3